MNVIHQKNDRWHGKAILKDPGEFDRYLLAFSLILLYDYNFLTRFDREPFQKLYILGTGLAGLVLFVRFLNIKNEGKGYILASILLVLIGGMYFLVRHSFYFLVLAILIVGARHVDAQKIYAAYLFLRRPFLR